MKHEKVKKSLDRWKWFILAAGIVGSSSLVIAMHNDWLRIQGVELSLADGSAEDVMFQRIKTSLDPQFQAWTGRFFWSVPLTQVYDLVSRDKRVRKVSVFREFPSRLRVEIEPQTPVLAYLSTDHRFYPMAMDGTLLPALAVKDISDMPVVRGEDLRDEPALREKALQLFETIPVEGAFRRKLVSEIYFSKKDGFSVYLSGVDSDVKLGDTDFGPKISRVEKVLSYLESQNVKGRVIDARFSKKVVVRVRNNP